MINFILFLIITKLEVKFRIIREDHLEDDVTNQEFETYDEAYDLLESFYSEVCCSDADYEDRPYYQIIESNGM